MCTWIVSILCLLLQQYSLVNVIFGPQIDTSIITWKTRRIEHRITSKVKLVLKAFTFSKEPFIYRSALAGAKQVCI